ncbi:alpha/beta hydrolase [Zhongshania sp.]|jgi:pimeloyl-ACP methyl ester carboxylesterase|uniref:alpha/beta fold hydrolase n=1 Tax=Zhongshania sp. TaxID=1971902 RepID=UPI002A8304A9|nr:alpha/beta hydrolase [Zhongshania sp.]
MSAATVQRGYVSLKTGQLHYRVAGEKGAPVLLLVHQAPSSSVMYETMMANLAADYYVLAPDLPGFGQSDHFPEAKTIAGWADVLLAFCRATIGTVTLRGVFGHHTGAAVATELLYRHPEIADCLMLSGPTLLNQKLKNILPEKAREFPVTKDGLHLLGMWQRMQGKDETAELRLVLRETLLGLGMGERYPDAYKAVIDHDFQRAIGAIQQPVLMFAGTADPLYSVLDDAFAPVQRGVITRIPNTASWVCDQQPNTVCGLIQRFLKSGLHAGGARRGKEEWPCES